MKELLAGWIGMMLAWGAGTTIVFLIPGDQGIKVIFIFVCLMPLGFATGYNLVRGK